MARRRKKTQKKNGPSAPAWMVTYSDMVTLLLTFFVLMLSMAEMDKIKFRQAVGSLKGAFGVMKSEPVNETKTDMVLPSVGVIPYDMVQRLYNQILMKIKKLDLNRNIEVVTDRGAIVLRIKEKILFAPGSTSLKKGGGSVLQKVAALVSPLPFDMRIEGHTDNTPYGVEGRTNWDLSVQRAITVLKYYVGNKQLSLDRLSAVGYGDTKPLVPNDSPENRALNRRVEFVLEAGGDYRKTLPYLIDSSEQLPF
ncbi:MAG: flagellar motor protein MotB [Desulfohalobiaceae bacterium]|nr:flagellar motor protein MotB [Desulfohalobiaceae bacterium]